MLQGTQAQYNIGTEALAVRVSLVPGHVLAVHCLRRVVHRGEGGLPPPDPILDTRSQV